MKNSWAWLVPARHKQGLISLCWAACESWILEYDEARFETPDGNVSIRQFYIARPFVLHLHHSSVGGKIQNFLYFLFEIQFTIMSSHMEQSHGDTLSGFNHSKSQRERKGKRGRVREGQEERETERRENQITIFLKTEMVTGQRRRRPPPARKLCCCTHTGVHTHIRLLFYQCHWTQTDG